MGEETSTIVAWLENEEGQRFDLGPSFSIGRSSGCDLTLSDTKISRRHVTIHRQGDSEYWISDLGSANGTYVNQNRIAQPLRLRDGDKIKMGPFELKYVSLGDRGEESVTALTTQQTLVDLKRERRWLLVADIENSTMLASSLDAKIYRQYVDDWFRKARELIQQERGSINKFLGDGFLATWAELPDAKERVATALKEFGSLRDELPFRFRLVLHYGEIIMGGIGTAGEESLSGPEVNFAFRMEKIAGTNGIAIMLSEPASTRLGDIEGRGEAQTFPVSGFAGEYSFFSL